MEECSAVDRRPKPDMETGSLACSHAFSSRLLPRRRPSASLISPSKRFQTDKLDDGTVVRIRYVIFGIEKHDLKRTYSKCPSSKLGRVSRMVLTLSTLSVIFIAVKSSFPIGAPRCMNPSPFIAGMSILMGKFSCLSGKLEGHHIEVFDLVPGVAAVDKYSPLLGPSSLYLYFKNEFLLRKNRLKKTF